MYQQLDSRDDTKESVRRCPCCLSKEEQQDSVPGSSSGVNSSPNCCARFCRCLPKVRCSIKCSFAVAALSIAIIGGVFLLVATIALTNLPSEEVCTQQGYPGADCTNTEQARFTQVVDPTCILKSPLDLNCLQGPPVCCLGIPNRNNSWTTPLGAQTLLSINQVSCSDIAMSAKMGLKKCGLNSIPCPEVGKGILAGADIPDSTLDAFHDASYSQCIQSRLQAGFFFLYLSGPCIVVSMLILSVAHARNFKPLMVLGLFIASIAATIVIYGLAIILQFRQQLGWQGSVACNEMDPQYVKKGMYLEQFPCHDQTVGGEHKSDPDYTYMSQYLLYYTVGAVLGLVSICFYVTLLITHTRIKEKKEKDEDAPTTADGSSATSRRDSGSGLTMSGVAGSSLSSSSASGMSHDGISSRTYGKTRLWEPMRPSALVDAPEYDKDGWMTLGGEPSHPTYENNRSNHIHEEIGTTSSTTSTGGKSRRSDMSDDETNRQPGKLGNINSNGSRDLIDAEAGYGVGFLHGDYKRTNNDVSGRSRTTSGRRQYRPRTSAGRYKPFPGGGSGGNSGNGRVRDRAYSSLGTDKPNRTYL